MKPDRRRGDGARTALVVLVTFIAFVGVVGLVAACLPSEPTTPLGYVIAPSSAPGDAGPLDSGTGVRAIAEPPP